jgi:hypothetical protein
MQTTTLIDACATPIYELGGAFYFTPETAAVGERFGLDVFMLYCLGRGGVLGDVDVQSVIDAFIWYQPAVVTTQWEEGRALADPVDVAAAYVEAARAYARRTFKGTADLGRFCEAAAKVVAAAPHGRWALVDGYRRYELPDDRTARAFQLIVVLRELRGAAHGEAVAAVGISPSEAHYLSGADAFELYGYDVDDMPEVTDELVERRALAEDRTTELLVSSYEVLDDQGRDDFLEGVRELAAHADIAVEDVAD